jgi:hypothetical protein
MLEGSHQAVQADEEDVGSSRGEIGTARARHRRPDRRRGILQEAVTSISRAPKTDLAAHLSEGRARAVADKLSAPRSFLAERLSRPARPHGPCRRPEAARPRPTICAIVDARTNSASRRVTALVSLVLCSHSRGAATAWR